MPRFYVGCDSSWLEIKVEGVYFVKVFVEDSFDSAHWLPNVPAGHKCGAMHGHTYRIRIEVDGPVEPESGWVIDYADLKYCWSIVKAELDHRCLNEAEGLSNPTCELIAEWISKRLAPIHGLSRIELRETASCGVVWEAE